MDIKTIWFVGGIDVEDVRGRYVVSFSMLATASEFSERTITHGELTNIQIMNTQRNIGYDFYDDDEIEFMIHIKSLNRTLNKAGMSIILVPIELNKFDGKYAISNFVIAFDCPEVYDVLKKACLLRGHRVMYVHEHALSTQDNRLRNNKLSISNDEQDSKNSIIHGFVLEVPIEHVKHHNINDIKSYLKKSMTRLRTLVNNFEVVCGTLVFQTSSLNVSHSYVILGDLSCRKVERYSGNYPHRVSFIDDDLRNLENSIESMNLGISGFGLLCFGLYVMMGDHHSLDDYNMVIASLELSGAFTGVLLHENTLLKKPELIDIMT